MLQNLHLRDSNAASDVAVDRKFRLAHYLSGARAQLPAGVMLLELERLHPEHRLYVSNELAILDQQLAKFREALDVDHWPSCENET